MLAIFAMALGLIIIFSAMGADRSARSGRTLLAIGLNVCGIFCLMSGLLTIYAWNGSRVVTPPQVEVASAAESATQVVRLTRASDGRLTPAISQVVSKRNDPAEPATVPAEKVPEVEEDNHHLSTAEGAATEIVGLDEPLKDVEAVPAEATMSWDELEQLEGDALDEDLAPEIRAQVQIDFDARPAWVDRPDADVNGVHEVSVSAGPYLRPQRARRELYTQLETATNEYINELVGNAHGSQWVRLSKDEIRRTLVAPEHYYDEKVVSPSFGVMYQSHALLRFDPAFHDRVEQAWHQVLARTQLAKVALVGGAILGVLLLLFGYFNADTATRGFYSGRLKFLTAVAILGLLVAGLWIAGSIPWLWL